MFQNSKNCEYFPLFFDMTGRPVMIVGAGAIATRRAGVLADFGAAITVIAPEGTEEMQLLESQGRVRWLHRSYEPEDLSGLQEQSWYMVLAATSDHELNSRITAAARAAGVLANHAGDHTQCDFFFPAVVRTDDIVIGVTSTNQNHKFVRRIAAKLRDWLKDCRGNSGEEKRQIQ